MEVEDHVSHLTVGWRPWLGPVTLFLLAIMLLEMLEIVCYYAFFYAQIMLFYAFLCFYAFMLFCVFLCFFMLLILRGGRGGRQ